MGATHPEPLPQMPSTTTLCGPGRNDDTALFMLPDLRLQATAGRFQGQVFKVTGDGGIIGRDGATIALNSTGVSRQHARILYQEGRFYVVDLDSRNGTWVNGHRLGKEPRPLDPGDVLRFADNELRVTLPDEVDLPAAPAAEGFEVVAELPVNAPTGVFPAIVVPAAATPATAVAAPARAPTHAGGRTVFRGAALGACGAFVAIVAALLFTGSRRPVAAMAVDRSAAPLPVAMKAAPAPAPRVFVGPTQAAPVVAVPAAPAQVATVATPRVVVVQKLPTAHHTHVAPVLVAHYDEQDEATLKQLHDQAIAAYRDAKDDYRDLVASGEKDTATLAAAEHKVDALRGQARALARALDARRAK